MKTPDATNKAASTKGNFKRRVPSVRERRITRAATYVLMAFPMGIGYDFFARSAPGVDFYTTVAQVIVAMYLAVALESFVSGGTSLGRSDRAEFAVLLSISWIGLIACLRGIVIPGESWTGGLGGAGLIAAALLVTTNLANRVSIANKKLVHWVILIACLAPLPILVPPP